MPRPLSPHLMIYRPQLTSVLSILHRMTGAGLVAGLGILVIWLAAAAWMPPVFEILRALIASPLGLLLLAGWSWALCYHLCNGVRHMLWDSGCLLSLPAVYASGRVVVLVSLLLTAGLWVCPWLAR